MAAALAVVKDTGTALENTNLDSDLFTKWVNYVDAKPKTVETYTKNIKYFMQYLQEQGITAPTRDTILAYRDMLNAKYKPTTVQGYMAAVRLFFQWTEAEGKYPNISSRVRGAKVTSEHKKDYLTSNQANRLLKSIDRTTLKGKRDYAVIFLMVTTGLRTISVVNANIEDIKTAGDSTVLYYIGKGKDGKDDDYVKITEPVELAINEYLQARGLTRGSKGPLFSPTGNRNHGGQLTTKSVSLIVKERLRAIGLDSDRLTAHSLRHTAATLCLLNGSTLEEAQQLLGHANINTTMIYTHALKRANNQSEQRITDALTA